MSFEPLPIHVEPAWPAVEPADLLIVPVFEGEAPASVPGLDAALGGEWRRAAESGEFVGKPLETMLAPLRGAEFGARRALLLGAGPAAQYSHDVARRIAAAGSLTARQRRAPRAAVWLRTPPAGEAGEAPDRRLVAQALAEGLTLAQVETTVHKSTPSERVALADVRVVVPDGASDLPALQDAADRGRLLAAATNDARMLGNEPGNVLTPRAFAERAQALAQGTSLLVDVLDESRIAALGMGLLLGVARGSAEPPRMIVLTHEPPAAAGGPVLALVGKGITFDTGGISIKPAEGMERMKADMGGGAAVIAAMRAIALLGVPARVIGVVPSTENMPGSRAVKPGDVLRGASGKTVEVVNTDAEGRLVLGDGLWYARELGATHLVDVATLTGACVVALGRITTGLFGTPDAWVEQVRRAAERAGERAWPMPVDDEYFDQLKSETADMSNTGGRPAGAITAALFLKQFVGDLPWAHLDIAGTSWIDEPRPWQVKGASGTAARTLIELASEPAWA
jgi:leucyl aminopeptidase